MRDASKRRVVKGKVNVMERTLDIVPLRVSSPQKR